MGESLFQAQRVFVFALVLLFFVCLFLLLSLDFHCCWAGFLTSLVLTADSGVRVREGVGFAGRTGPAMCL